MPKKFMLGFIWYMITKFPMDFVKERTQWIKEGIKMLFKKNDEYYQDISNLAFYWKDFAQKITLSKKRLKFIADEGAMFACFMSNKIGLKNFIMTVIKSDYRDYIMQRWQKRSKSRDWRLRYGAQFCLGLMTEYRGEH